MALVDPLFYTFLVAVLALSLAVGRRRQWPVLLAASYAFCAADGLAPVLTLAGVTLSTWACGRALSPGTPPRWRATALGVGIAVPLAALVGQKYLGFLLGALGGLGRLLGAPSAPVALPTLATLGLSYYALQAIAYLVDVHEEAIPPERHLGRLALSLAFFPKLVQGPIERGETLLPQLARPAPLALGDLRDGALLVLWGLFQKAAVADRLAPFVAAVYGDVHGHAGLPVIAATYLFAAQLYLDFAGYTGVALGIARLFGIRLTPNFRAPYLATSVAEFWRRWHISFSSWLQDYVFRRLQLRWRRERTFGTPLALFATFLVSGLWHGAAWTFVVWGGIHGLLLAGSVLLRARRAPAAPGPVPRWRTAIRVGVTFHLVCLSWIFFRARSVADGVWAILSLPAGAAAGIGRVLRGAPLAAELGVPEGQGHALVLALALVVACALFRPVFQRLEVGEPGPVRLRLPRPLVIAGAAAVLGVMTYLVAFAGSRTQGFLYAQF